MKKILAIQLAAMILFSFVACSTNDAPSSNESSGTSQIDNQGSSENNGGENTDLPAAVEIPYDKYPWLEGIVLPDDAVVTDFDDEYYEEDGVVTMVIKPITTAEQVAAYEAKLKAAGYTEAEVSGLVSPNGKFEMSVGSMWVESMGYMNLTIYDTFSSLEAAGDQWSNATYVEYTNGVSEPPFKYIIKGVLMDQLTINAEATLDEINTWKQSLLNNGFEEYREGEQWGIKSATHNIQMNGYVDGVAFIYISLEG